MKKLIILLIIVLMISVVIAKEKIKETDKYKAYKIKVKEKDAIKFELKENKSIDAVELIKDFIEMEKGE